MKETKVKNYGARKILVGLVMLAQLLNSNWDFCSDSSLITFFS